MYLHPRGCPCLDCYLEGLSNQRNEPAAGVTNRTPDDAQGATNEPQLALFQGAR